MIDSTTTKKKSPRFARPAPELAREERDAGYCTARYRIGESYRLPFWRSEYFPLWAEVVARIPDGSRILELGCGAGQFAALLAVCGFRGYLGVDFAPDAIALARRAAPDMRFATRSIYEPEIYSSLFDVVVACEVLEHVDDERVLRLVPPRTLVVATLPNFGDAEEHLRCFANANDVRKRYGRFFSGHFSVVGPIVPQATAMHGAGFFLLRGTTRC